MIDSFKKWLITKLGGFTEKHLIWTKDYMYFGTDENGLTKVKRKKSLDKVTIELNKEDAKLIKTWLENQDYEDTEKVINEYNLGINATHMMKL
jgi:hypothetical protein